MSQSCFEACEVLTEASLRSEAPLARHFGVLICIAPDLPIPFCNPLRIGPIPGLAQADLLRLRAVSHQPLNECCLGMSCQRRCAAAAPSAAVSRASADAEALIL